MQTCKHCGKRIYSAGGPANEGALGWLHQESGNARCTPPVMPRAEPKK